MEINPFFGTLVGNLFLGVGILISVSVVNLFKSKFITKIDYLTSITVGLLIGIIFLGFVPEIFEEASDPEHLGIYILGGLLLFYILELFLHWHHCKDLGHDSCHEHHSHEKSHESNSLMFSGTLLHNSFHGIILFSSFSVSFHFGIVTTIALLLHSIPQNIANYIMNHNNYKYNIIAAFGGVLGALITYPFISFLIDNKTEILSIITGGLLYTALTDIFPGVKKKGELKHKIIYLFFIVFGVMLFYIFNEMTHLH